MYKLLLLFCVLSLGLHSQNAMEGRTFHYQKEMKWQLGAMAYGNLQFQYEKFNSRNSSINAFGNVFNLFYSGVFKGFGLGSGYRSYFTPERKHSYFVEPFAKYQFMKDPYNTRYYTLSAGLVLGRKWFLSDRFSAEFFMGPCFNLGFIKETSTSNNTLRFPVWMGPVNGIWARYGFNIGYKFN